jgi:hypothetical protein
MTRDQLDQLLTAFNQTPARVGVYLDKGGTLGDTVFRHYDERGKPFVVVKLGPDDFRAFTPIKPEPESEFDALDDYLGPPLDEPP